MGASQMSIMGWVIRWTDPGAHARCWVTATTAPLVWEKHRLLWRCHWVRQPPGMGGTASTWLMPMVYIAATSTAPPRVLA